MFVRALHVFIAPVLVAGMAAVGQTNSTGSTSSQTATIWQTKDGIVILHNFKFGSGEILPQLKLHYLTLGTSTH